MFRNAGEQRPDRGTFGNTPIAINGCPDMTMPLEDNNIRVSDAWRNQNAPAPCNVGITCVRAGGDLGAYTRWMTQETAARYSQVSLAPQMIATSSTKPFTRTSRKP